MNGTDEEKRVFAEIFGLAAEIYGQPKPTRGALKILYEILGEYSMEDVRSAMEDHLRSSPFPPKPADIVKRIDGSAEERALWAFQCVARAMEQLGYVRSVKWSDPRIHYAVDRMGGWMALCERCTAEKLPFIEKDFVRHYSYAERRHVSWEYPGLPHAFRGFIDAENQKKGLDAGEVVLADEEALSALREASTQRALEYKEPAPVVSEEERQENMKLVAQLMDGLMKGGNIRVYRDSEAGPGEDREECGAEGLPGWDYGPDVFGCDEQ